MDEDKSTPDAPVTEDGGEETPTQTPDTEQAPAEKSDSKANQEDSTPTATQDKEFSNFAKGQGFSEEDLNNPAVIKALEIAQKSRKTATEGYERQSELEQQLREIGKKSQPEEQEYADPLEAEIAALKKDQADTKWENQVTMFLAKNPDAFDLVETMDKIAEENPHLSQDLNNLYKLAKLESTDPATIKAEGRREAEQRLAQGQQASAPSRSASNAAPQGKQTFTRSQISAMGRAEYEENRSAIIAAEQAGQVVEDI